MSELKGKEASLYINTLPPSPFGKPVVKEWNILSLKRATKRKEAELTIQIPDELAASLIEQTMNQFSHMPVRKFRLEWIQYEKEQSG